MPHSPQQPLITALAIEASERPTSIAVRTPSGARTRTLDDSRAHASDLVPAIATLLEELEVAASDLDVVIAGTGPGSYTGLRVASATSLGLKLGSSARLVGVPSFAAIALGGLRAGERGMVVRDAFGGYGYAAVYERRADDQLVVVREPWCEPLESLRANERLASDIVFADSRALERLGRNPAEFREVRSTAPRAGEVLSLGLLEFESSGGAQSAEEVRPLYLRAFGT